MSPKHGQLQRIKLLVSYDGTDFCGWQKQKEHLHGPEKPSLQETLELALQDILKHPVDVCASGRTDAGVHALAQIAHFDTDKTLPKDLAWALRGKLPPSMVIRQAWTAPSDFHATTSATHKTYRYWIWNSFRPTALMSRYTAWVRNPLDLDYLNEQAQILVKNQDFKSFQTVGTPVKTTVREVYKAHWRRKSPHLVEFQITGSGFLKQMVRNIVGTQLDLYTKGQTIEKMEEILAAKDRRRAGTTAPPQGLFLAKVYYPSELDKQCAKI